MKKKSVKRLQKLLKALEIDNLQMILGIIVVILFVLYYKWQDFDIKDIIDFPVLIAFLALYSLKKLSELVSSSLTNKLEDYIKIERDYNALIKRYPLENDFVSYDNPACSPANKERFRKQVDTTCTKEADNYSFPVILEKNMTTDALKTKTIRIEDNKQKKYMPPDIIKDNFKHLMDAHSTSTLYNQVNIRLDDITEDQTDVTLHTSRTYYFDSLVTNRVIDFLLPSGISVRETLNPGPYVDPLKDSLLSNHLGFNIFIKTNDNKIVFVERNMDVSIGKGTLGSSVAASLKTRYCVDEAYNFTIAGLERAVIEEINDELGLSISYDEFSIKKHLIAIYRELIEGGKPQFLFYIEIDESEEQVREYFAENLKIEDKKYETIVDGTKLAFLDLSKKSEFYLAPDSIFFNNQSYAVLPSVSGTLAYLLNLMEAGEL